MPDQSNGSPERCNICNCVLHRDGGYAQPTHAARSHATSHHLIAERFFGRSRNRAGEHRDRIFDSCPWDSESATSVFCYECHEIMLHNPVLLPDDLARFSELVRARGLDEEIKPNEYHKIAGRIRLFHEIIEVGLNALLSATPK